MVTACWTPVELNLRIEMIPSAWQEVILNSLDVKESIEKPPSIAAVVEYHRKQGHMYMQMRVRGVL